MTTSFIASLSEEVIPCSCQHLELLNRWSSYRYENDHRCANDFPDECLQCENILCQVWKEQQHAPQLNTATFFCIQTNGTMNTQISTRSKPYQYLPFINKSSGEEIIIHHACTSCIDEHPLKEHMASFPNGLHAILSKTRGNFHRIYGSIPLALPEMDPHCAHIPVYEGGESFLSDESISIPGTDFQYFAVLPNLVVVTPYQLPSNDDETFRIYSIGTHRAYKLVEQNPFVMVNAPSKKGLFKSRAFRPYLEPIFSHIQVPTEILMIWDTHFPQTKGYYKAYDLDAKAVNQFIGENKRDILSYNLAVTNTMTDIVLATFDLIDQHGLVHRHTEIDVSLSEPLFL